MGIRAEAVKRYKRSESKCKKEIKALKKQNKILYRISNKFGTSREIKKIDNMRSKGSKKRHSDSIDSSTK